MLNLLAVDASLAPVLGIVIGLVAAIVIFGLVLLYAFMPQIKNRSKGEPAEEQPQKVEKAEQAAVAEEPQEQPKEQPVEEVAEEPEEEPQAVQEEEDAKVVPVEEVTADEGESEEEFAAREAAIAAAPAISSNERYDRSYTARLVQSSSVLKEWYSEIKNAALSYKGAKSSIAWKQEKLRCTKQLIAKLIIRGKTLCVYFPLNPDEVDERIKAEDVSGKAVNAATPTMLRIKNPFRVKQAKELVDAAAKKLGLEPNPKYKPRDFKAELPLRTTEELLNDGLIKIAAQTKYSDIPKKS